MAGNMFVLAGPSGAGKSTLEKRLFKEVEGLTYSVSATTRTPRPGEVEGRDYFFKSAERFQEMIDNRGLLEWAEFYGNRYGTPADFVRQTLARGRDLVIDVEVEGVEQIRERQHEMLGEGVYILVVPPSMSALAERLNTRGTEDAAAVRTRLDRARYELEKLVKLARGSRRAGSLGYDYLIINDDLETAYRELKAIVVATRCALHSRSAILDRLFAEEL